MLSFLKTYLDLQTVRIGYEEDDIKRILANLLETDLAIEEVQRGLLYLGQQYPSGKQIALKLREKLGFTHLSISHIV